MELKGKKIAFLGDSITEGVGASSPEDIYWKVVEKESGAHCYGYGISGTRIAPQRVKSEEASWDLYFGSRVEEMIPDADVVVVFGGTNDFGHGDAAFGHMQDRTQDSFYGACHLLMQQLIDRYPRAQLVVMTPLHRISEDEDDYNEFGLPRQGRLERYVNAICEVAAFYGVPVVDLYRTCSIQPRVPSQMELYMPDGLHPNDLGFYMMYTHVLPVVRQALGLK